MFEEEELFMKSMPVLFVGHGSPMNAIEDNKYAQSWKDIVKDIPKPEAILAISAHWYTRGRRINNAQEPRIIYDMYGFPEELYQVKYPVKGSLEFASLTRKLLSPKVSVDNSWGVDHGTWSVLRRMYPQAEIPVFQVSVDQNSSAEEQFEIGKDIATLRDKGVLILGSGNIVHNLSLLNGNMKGGYDWAIQFDHFIKERILHKDYDSVVNFQKAGESAKKAFSIPDHFFPLLSVLGAVSPDDQTKVFNDSCVLGSLSMTSYLFGKG